MLRLEPGWVGMFSRHHHPGAYPNGARVAKVNGEPGDMTPLGTQGTVLGSLDASYIETPPGHPGGKVLVCYFVEWDDKPRTAVGTTDWKLGPLGAFRCPRCSAESHSAKDAQEGYCGACHEYTGRVCQACRA